MGWRRWRISTGMLRGYQSFARCVSLAWFCAVPLMARQAPTPSPAKAPIVAGIRVQPAPTWKESAFLPMVAQKIGQPLNRKAVESSIQNLFSTGVFADITAVERPVRGGIELQFETRPNYFLGGLRVKGAPGPPSNTELLDVSGLQLGQLYDQARQRQALAQIEQRLAAYNYRQARIAPELAFRQGRAEVVLTLLITPGPLVRVGSVGYQGQGAISNALLLRTTKLHGGEELPQSRLRHALRRLHQFTRSAAGWRRPYASPPGTGASPTAWICNSRLIRDRW